MKKISAVFISIILTLMLISPIMSLATEKSERTTVDTKATETGFVYANGNHFFCDGKYFYFAGCNSYNLHRYGDGSNTGSIEDICTKFMHQDEIDQCMQEMADAGVTVVRTWAFSSDSWHGFESYKDGRWVYNEAEFMELDYIMYSAQQHGIKVILTLENYWEGLGGIDAKLTACGLPSNAHAARAAYFSNETCKTWYKAYAKHLIERTNYFTNVQYKDDPTVFAWDLMNEPRYENAGENSTGTTLRAWVDEMGAYVKGLDSNHMVCVGIEGHESKYGFGGNEGNPFVYIQQSPYIDFCSAHPYPDENWANLTPAQTASLVRAWINDSHNVIGKPFVIGEFNVKKSNAQMEQYWRAVFDTLYEEDAAGGLFWDYYTSSQSEFTVMKGMSILTYFKSHSEQMQAKNVGVNMTNLSPARLSIDRAQGYEDQQITMNYYGSDSLTAIKCGTVSLVKGTDYSVSGNTVTLKSSYLSTLDLGTTTLSFVVGEKNPNLSIVISDSSIKSPDDLIWKLIYECESDFSDNKGSCDKITFNGASCIRGVGGYVGAVTIDVPEDETYTFTLRAGSSYVTLNCALTVDGASKGSFKVSGGTALTDCDIEGIILSAGKHTVTIDFGDEYNAGFDYLKITCQALNDSVSQNSSNSNSNYNSNNSSGSQNSGNSNNSYSSYNSGGSNNSNSGDNSNNSGNTGEAKKGDVNMDDVVDILDVVLVRAHIVGNSELSSEALNRADMNDDEAIDISDIVVIRGIIVNG